MNAERADLPLNKGTTASGPGPQLKAQREAMGWTVDQVADQLKLAQRQVVALEEGDFAALPNMAVVRGFVRAYAKVVKLEAAPLVAMIDVGAGAGGDATPARREISTTFSETRFPSMTQRSKSGATGWIIALAVVLAGLAIGAYEMGYISPSGLMRSAKTDNAGAARSATAPAAGSTGAAATTTPVAAAGAAGATTAPVETRLVKPGDVSANTLQSTSVPLISVPSPAANGAAPAAPTTRGSAALAGATAVGAAATAAAPGAAPAAAGDNALVLIVSEDSWVELRRSRGAPLIARLVKAGSVETFNITEPVTLVVGKPSGVAATLRGASLPLPSASGAVARLSIK